MDEPALLEGVTVNPAIVGGKPIIRGLRISVALILSPWAQEASSGVIPEDYPRLMPGDICV